MGPVKLESNGAEAPARDASQGPGTEMKHKTSKTLYAYWNEIRGTRQAPRRFEIEPARLAPILPEAFILERLDASSYRFRLAGTRLCEYFGMEFRGRNFMDLWGQSDGLAVGHTLSRVADRGAVALLELEARGPSGRTVHFEALIAPLSQSNSVIDRFLGAMSTTDNAHWLGSEPLTERYLLRHELIWPDQLANTQLSFKPVLDPAIRDARLVRVDRRNFRVYEGGLSRLYQETD